MSNSNNISQKFGLILGFIVAYIIFTAIVSLIWKLTGKISTPKGFVYVALITMTISLMGVLVKEYLR